MVVAIKETYEKVVENMTSSILRSSLWLG